MARKERPLYHGMGMEVELVLWGGELWRRGWLSSRSPSPAPSSHAHAGAVRAGAELSGGEGALPAAAGRGTCASPCPPSPARQQQWCSGRGSVKHTHAQTPVPLASIGGKGPLGLSEASGPVTRQR